MSSATKKGCTGEAFGRYDIGFCEILLSECFAPTVFWSGSYYVASTGGAQARKSEGLYQISGITTRAIASILTYVEPLSLPTLLR